MTTHHIIPVIVGSTREGRFADTAARWIADLAEKTLGVSAPVIDLRDYSLPFFNEAVSPSMIVEPYNNPEVARFTKLIAEGDAFIMVAPEYNHGPTAVLKNAIDWVGKEWHRKPVAFVSYGSVGGARAVEQLRQNLIELHMAPIRDAVHIPGKEYFGMRFGGIPTEAEMLQGVEKSAHLMLEQLGWWTRALKVAREG
jgi:NAD(P)H-dependent FMN reductase